MTESLASIERRINQKRSQLKTLTQKYELNNKKIKLLRKQNQDLKSTLEKQIQADTTTLLQSKQLSDANTKLQQAIEQLQAKLLQPEQNLQNVPDFVSVGNLTINPDTFEIDLTGKQLTDQEVMEIQPYHKFQSIILDGNKITAVTVSMVVENMKNLKKLLLNSCVFEVGALANIGTLTNMKVLQVNGDQLGDHCLQYICKLPNLTQLSVSKNKITDMGAQNLINLSQSIIYLDINNNLLTDQGVKSILELKRLTHLYIGWNKLSYLGVKWLIKELTSLDALDARLNLLGNQDKEKVRGERPEKLQLFC